VAALRGGAVAMLTMLVLWAALDSGVAAAAPGTSGALLAMALLFGVGAWAFGVGGRGEHSPVLTGLASGLALYALLRLVLV
jgi:hypothetical protein